MAITITWIVEAMDSIPSFDGLTDVVKTVHWRANGTDGTFNATVYNTQSFAAPDPAAFTPYDQLTKEQVLDWLFAKIDKNAVESSLAQQIDNLINPPIVTKPNPWNA